RKGCSTLAPLASASGSSATPRKMRLPSLLLPGARAPHSPQAACGTARKGAVAACSAPQVGSPTACHDGVGPLARKPCSSVQGALSRPLARTALQILQVLAHLLEGKPQCEEAFGQLRIELAREALPAEFVDQRRISVKSGFDRIAWRWSAAGAKRIANAAEVVGK